MHFASTSLLNHELNQIFATSKLRNDYLISCSGLFIKDNQKFTKNIIKILYICMQ